VKSFKLFVVLGCLGLSACAPSEADLLGKSLYSDSSAPVYAPSLAFGPNGHLVVAWADSNDIYVRRWTGTEWEALGSKLSAFPGETSAYWSDVAVDGQGDPVVAWGEYVAGNSIRKSIVVRRWSGGNWVELGGPLNIGPNTSDAYKPSLRLDSEGNPLVAWSEQSGGPQLAVRRWGPAGWEALGSTPIATGTAWGLELAGNTPILVSHRSEDYNRIQFIEVRRWNGSTWEMLGDPVGENAIAPQLRADAAGNLVLAWLQQGGLDAPDRLRVARWSGTAWEALGPEVAVGNDKTNLGVPGLALDAEGQPLVSWIQEQGGSNSLWVARWTGQDWSVKEIEKRSLPLLDLDYGHGSATLEFHPAEGGVVAWIPYGSPELRVLRLLP
jgi:hypothetical protein